MLTCAAAHVIWLVLPAVAHAQTLATTESASFGYDLLGEFARRQMEEEYIWGRYLWRQMDPSTYARKETGHAQPQPDTETITQTAPVADGAVVRRLVREFAPTRGAEAEALLGSLLRAYGGIERDLHWPTGEVAGALAWLVSAAMSIDAGRELSGKQLKKMAAQFRSALVESDEFRRSSPAQRREIYERAAILGTVLHLLRSQVDQDSPVRAQLQVFARRTVQSVVGVEPALLRIGPDGLQIAR